MEDPGTRLFTVRVESACGQSDEDRLDSFAQSLTEAGVMDPAVLLLAEGRLACTGQVTAYTATDAIIRFLCGWTGINLVEIHAYEGEVRD